MPPRNLWELLINVKVALLWKIVKPTFFSSWMVVSSPPPGDFRMLEASDSPVILLLCVCVCVFPAEGNIFASDLHHPWRDGGDWTGAQPAPAGTLHLPDVPREGHLPPEPPRLPQTWVWKSHNCLVFSRFLTSEILIGSISRAFFIFYSFSLSAQSHSPICSASLIVMRSEVRSSPINFLCLTSSPSQASTSATRRTATASVTSRTRSCWRRRFANRRRLHRRRRHPPAGPGSRHHPGDCSTLLGGSDHVLVAL